MANIAPVYIFIGIHSASIFFIDTHFITLLPLLFPGPLFIYVDIVVNPVTVVIMYGAGGGTDTITRVLVDEMAKNTGWNIKAINKPGAVGGIATKYVSSQKSDGYTILGAANYNKFVRVMGHMPADQLPWENWIDSC